MTTVRRLALRLLLAVGLAQLTASASAAQARDAAAGASLVKVAYLYNFAKFSRWPAHTGLEEDIPLRLCTVGEDDVTLALGQVRGKTVKGHPIVLKSVQDGDTLGDCHMLYVASSEQLRLGGILHAVQGLPILTVSELPRFGSTGGMIELYRDRDRIRFIINIKVARAAGIEISPNLLRLAEVLGLDDTP